MKEKLLKAGLVTGAMGVGAVFAFSFQFMKEPVRDIVLGGVAATLLIVWIFWPKPQKRLKMRRKQD